MFPRAEGARLLRRLKNDATKIVSNFVEVAIQSPFNDKRHWLHHNPRSICLIHDVFLFLKTYTQTEWLWSINVTSFRFGIFLCTESKSSRKKKNVNILREIYRPNIFHSNIFVEERVPKISVVSGEMKL